MQESEALRFTEGEYFWQGVNIAVRKCVLSAIHEATNVWLGKNPASKIKLNEINCNGLTEAVELYLPAHVDAFPWEKYQAPSPYNTAFFEVMVQAFVTHYTARTLPFLFKNQTVDQLLKSLEKQQAILATLETTNEKQHDELMSHVELTEESTEEEKENLSFADCLQEALFFLEPMSEVQSLLRQILLAGIKDSKKQKQALQNEYLFNISMLTNTLVEANVRQRDEGIIFSPDLICCKLTNMLKDMSFSRDIRAKLQTLLDDIHKGKVLYATKHVEEKKVLPKVNLRLSSVQLDSLDTPLSFVDTNTQQPIAYVFKENGCVYIVGCGNDLTVTLEGGLEQKADAWVIDNPSGNLTLDTTCYTSGSINLVSRAKQLTFQGIIEAENLHWYHQGALVVPEESILLSRRALELDVGSMKVSGSILSCSDAKVHLRSGMTLSKQGKLVAKENLEVEAADSIYLKGKAHLQATALRLQAKSCMMLARAILRATQANINLSNQLIMEGGMLFLDHAVIQSPNLKNNGTIYCKEALLQTKGNCVNNENGKLVTEDHLIVQGGSLYNQGYIKFGKKFQAYLNKLFVQGATNFSQLSQRFKSKKYLGAMHGEHAEITTGAYVNIFSRARVSTFELTALAEFNLGLLEASMTNKSSLFALDLGIVLPEIEVRKAILQVLTDLRQGHFHEAFQHLGGLEKSTGFIRWFLQTFFPALGQPIELAWSAALFVISLPHLFHEVYGLFTQKEAIQPYQFYALANTVKQSFTNGLAIATDALSLSQGVKDKQSTPSLSTILIGLTQPLLPTVNNQALFALRGGVTLSGTLSTRDVFSYSLARARAGVTISDHFFVGRNDASFSCANTMTETGHAYEDNGVTLANQYAVNVNHLKESGKVTAKQLNIAAKDAVIEGKVQADTAMLNAANHLTLAKEGKLKANQLSIETKNGTIDGAIQAKTAQLNVVDNLSLAQLTADQAVFDVAALDTDLLESKGKFSGVKIKDHLYVHSKKSILLDQDLTLPYCATLYAPDVQVNSHLQGDKDLELISTEGDLLTGPQCNIEAKGHLSLESANNYINDGGKLRGDKSYVHAKKDIINKVGQISSVHHTALIAEEGNVINQGKSYYDYHSLDHLSRSHSSRSEGDYKKIYEVGRIGGGDGEGYEGIGTYISAGKKVINDGSIIESVGSNAIFGKEGIESIGYANRYLNYERDNKNIFHHWHTTEYKTQIQPATISSTSGRNYLVSEQGKIDSMATEFIAASGTDIKGEKGVHLGGYVAETLCKKETEEIFHKRCREEKSQAAIPTTVIDPAHINVVSKDEVLLDNALLFTQDANFSAKDLKVTTPILTQSIKEKSSGLNIFTPTTSSLPGYAMYTDGKQLFASNNAIEGLTSLSNLSVDTLVTASSALLALQTKALSGVFNPNAGLNYQIQSSDIAYQSTSPYAVIGCQNLTVDAEQAVFNADVNVTGDANIKAKQFSQEGVALKSCSNNQSASMNVGMALSGDVSLGVAQDSSAQASTIYQNQQFNVGGTLHIDAEDWQMKNANTNANKIDGSVDSLKIQSDLSYSDSQSQSRNIGMSINPITKVIGVDGGYSSQIQQSGFVNQRSGLYVQDHIGPEFKVNKKTTLIGSDIQSNGKIHFVSPEIEAVGLTEFNNSNNYGGSINLTPITKNPLPTTGSFQLGYDNYLATYTPTIFGQEGTTVESEKVVGELNTSSADGKKVLEEDSLNVNVKVPFKINETLETLNEQLTDLREAQRAAQFPSSPTEIPTVPDDPKPSAEIPSLPEVEDVLKPLPSPELPIGNQANLDELFGSAVADPVMNPVASPKLTVPRRYTLFYSDPVQPAQELSEFPAQKLEIEEGLSVKKTAADELLEAIELQSGKRDRPVGFINNVLGGVGDAFVEGVEGALEGVVAVGNAVMHPKETATQLIANVDATLTLLSDPEVLNANLKKVVDATVDATANKVMDYYENAKRGNFDAIGYDLGKTIPNLLSPTKFLGLSKVAFFAKTKVGMNGLGKNVNALEKLKYEGAPYHGKISNSVKSKAPENGQDILNSSIQVKPSSPRRIGIDYTTGEFVVFDRTRDNIYHGHVRAWEELHPDMKKALQEAAMVNKRGKKM